MRKEIDLWLQKLMIMLLLYAMCSQKEYERTIVNKSIGLFFTLGDDTIRVIVL